MRIRPTTSRPHVHRGLAVLGGGLVLALAMTGCSAEAMKPGGEAKAGEPTKSAAPPVSAAQLTATIAPAAQNVRIDASYRVTVANGTLTTFTVKGAGGLLAGVVSPDRLTWTSTARLQPNETYTVAGVATDTAGLTKAYNTTFATQKLSLDQQTFPSFSPVDGETVGVGMPVIVHFDVAIADKATIEKHLKVTTTPVQTGAFHWVSDREVHWRPQTYWQPGTDVVVNADIDSIPAGNGIFGQKSRQIKFHVGRSMVSKVNAQTHQMQIYRDGALVKTIPITTGKEGFTTRSGVKVIVEKFRHKRMNSETIGIANDSADGYDLDDVEYAMRLTYSGEFLHAAPWSVGSQGRANVSHGCTGMSTDNARWLYENSIRGDVVEYTGTSKYMTLTNGFGDWNASFADYAAGSAL